MQERIAFKNAGQLIRKLRMSVGMKAVELADMLGWTKQDLTKVETGILALSIDDLTSLASVFKVPLEELLLAMIYYRFPSALTSRACNNCMNAYPWRIHRHEVSR